MNTILIAVASLGVIALSLALILYAASRRFAVHEDPRVARISALLPQANCGGCGYPGCNGFADACVKAGTLDGKLCPVGGRPLMEQVAGILGVEAGTTEPLVAVVRCGGSCAARPQLHAYDGARSCAILSSLCMGETACAYGCLGCGDCADACSFGGLRLNPDTGLPEVDDAACTACGACVKVCPRGIIELRPRGKDGRLVYVQCLNRDKGGVARKACAVACIGCGKCVKACPFDAVAVKDNLASIDPAKCRSCRKCEEACPQGAIAALHFPPRSRQGESAVMSAAGEHESVITYL